MEKSDADRLPEVDSLPDGFVESSTDTAVVDPSIPDYKDALIDEVERSQSSLTGEEVEGSKRQEGDLVLPNDGKKTGAGCSVGSGANGADFPEALEDAMLKPEDKSRNSPVGEVVGADCTSSELGETGGCVELHTCQETERSIVDPECPKIKKTDNSEPKRKVAKRSAKLEKELLELTLKFQNSIAERNSAFAVRDKLESLCRELQRQNKMLMEEYQKVSTEGQHLRTDLSTKFSDAIKDVSTKLEEQKHEYLSQLKENEMLTNKLKYLADQFTLSEQQFEQKLKQKMLELQLADLKLQQHQERSAKEQTQTQLYEEQVAQLLETEKSLRLQLAADGEKFQQFQDALLKSNEVFETFKQEMEKMTKLIKDLKKENTFLKSKCEQSDFSLVKLIEERESMKKQLEKARKQKEKLESLCRSLQAERKQHSVGASNSDPAVGKEVKTDRLDES